ncbi:MAG: ubiquinone biosynthesis regulatory protein kinase UbiB [Gammaproteobacteria bacterium]|nr:ubiquinone biosynthesis regulatory protein kinase UbiB [Gammaproteobacteria bacterium]
MIRPSQLLRLLRINYVLMKHGLDDIVFEIHLFRPFRFILFLMPWNWVPRKRAPRGERLRCALEDLGPVFIKLGQMLSTRRDLLADDIAQELAQLQDNVPSFAAEQAKNIIEKSLKCSVKEAFLRFDDEPFASASIAQVHGAQLDDGTEVIVKVVRPGISKVIKRDVALMYVIAELAERYSKVGRRLRVIEVVAEYEKTIHDELNLQREAANASQLRRNFSQSAALYIPEVYWDYVRRDVMVMERISGIPIGQTDALIKHGVNLERLSERGVEIFFTQVFKHNFFHADMHPGNIFVDLKNPQNAQYIAVDFGIVGSLNVEDQRYLAENFLAFFKRDYQRVAQLHVDSGWVPADTRVDEFESAIRSVCEPIFEKPLKDISFGLVLLGLFQTAQRFNMEVQPQLVLLQKTLLNIEGLGRQLNPDLDLWKTAKPFLENWMDEQIGTKAMWRGFKKNLPFIAEKLPEMPNLIYAALNRAAEGENHEAQQREMRAFRKEIARSNQKTVSTIIGSSLIISAFIVYSLNPVSGALLWGVPVVSWISGVSGSLIIYFALKE